MAEENEDEPANQPWFLLTDNIGSVFLVVDSLLLFVMCTVTLQRLRDSVTQIYTFIIIIIIIIMGRQSEGNMLIIQVGLPIKLIYLSMFIFHCRAKKTVEYSYSDTVASAAVCGSVKGSPSRASSNVDSSCAAKPQRRQSRSKQSFCRISQPINPSVCAAHVFLCVVISVIARKLQIADFTPSALF